MSTVEKKITSALLVILLFIIGAGAVYLQKSQQDVTLRIGVYAGSYWDTPNGDSYQILDEAIKRFEKANPKVTVEYVSGIGTDDYSEWLAEQILQGTEPDLYFVLPEDFDMLVTSGALTNLAHLMKTDREFDASCYYEPCLKAGEYNGVQYAIPHESVPTIMFVNKTMLEEHGIAMPDDGWTWDEFYDICKAVTDVDAHRYGVYDYTWVNALYANGTELFDRDGKTCHLTDDRVQAAIRFVEKLDDLNEGYAVTSKDFDLGNVAFRPFLYSEYRAYQPYPWRVKKYTDFDWDGICMPAGENGDNVSELHTMLLGISARTDHQELAWEMAKMLSVDEAVQKDLYSFSRGISPVKVVAEDDNIVEMLRSDIPGGNGFDRRTIHKIMSTAIVTPHFLGFNQAMNMVESAVAEEMSENTNDSETMLSVQREINQYLLSQ